MATEVRITSAPLPSLTEQAAPESNLSAPNRMMPTETTSHDQAIVQQRQQALSNPIPPCRPHRSPRNQHQLPLTPLGYELVRNPRRCRDNPSTRSLLSPLQPDAPDPALTTALNPAAERSLTPDNRTPPSDNQLK